MGNSSSGVGLKPFIVYTPPTLEEAEEAEKSSHLIAGFSLLVTITLIVINSLGVAGTSGFTSGVTVGAINLSLAGTLALVCLNFIRKYNTPNRFEVFIKIIIALGFTVVMSIPAMAGALSAHTFSGIMLAFSILDFIGKSELARS